MPSASRTITWAPTTPGFVSNGLVWPSKLPLDTLDFSLDLSAWLQDAGDTISVVTAAERSGGLTVANITAAGGIVTAWISGGLFRAAPYLLDIVVTTVGGRVDDFLVLIAVGDGPTALPGTLFNALFAGIPVLFSNVPVTYGAST